MDTIISDHAALRIGMVAKSLPNLDLKSLLGLLIQHLGEPLSEEKLLKMSPKSFRLMLDSLDEAPSRNEVSEALAILTSPELGGVDAPEMVYTKPLSDPKLTVAVTSNQGELLNGHYGSCLRVLVYEVNSKEHQLVDIRPVDTELKGEERVKYMLSLLEGCSILFTLSIGGPAAARVTRAGIHPVKESKVVEINTMLEDLSNVIATNPPLWLRKKLGLSPTVAHLEGLLEEQEALELG